MEASIEERAVSKWFIRVWLYDFTEMKPMATPFTVWIFIGFRHPYFTAFVFCAVGTELFYLSSYEKSKYETFMIYIEHILSTSNLLGNGTFQLKTFPLQWVSTTDRGFLHPFFYFLFHGSTEAIEGSTVFLNHINLPVLIRFIYSYHDIIIFCVFFLSFWFW